MSDHYKELTNIFEEILKKVSPESGEANLELIIKNKKISRVFEGDRESVNIQISMELKNDLCNYATMRLYISLKKKVKDWKMKSAFEALENPHEFKFCDKNCIFLQYELADPAEYNNDDLVVDYDSDTELKSIDLLPLFYKFIKSHLIDYVGQHYIPEPFRENAEVILKRDKNIDIRYFEKS